MSDLTLPSKAEEGAKGGRAADMGQYDNRTDSSMHRRATDVLLRATEAEGSAPIVTFCPYAGKQGRPRADNNHNKEVSHAILSGTVLWLVCPFVNNCIARVERTGGVKKIDARLKTDAFLGPLHEASHRVYEGYVTRTLLTDPEEQARFLKMFVNVETNEEAHKKGNWNRKYGNAGVSGPRDLKCFHAVAAQALGGASNPVGCVVVNYLFHMYDVLQGIKDAERIDAAEEEVEEEGQAEAKHEKPTGDMNVASSSKASISTAAATAKKVEEGVTAKADPGAPSRRVFAEKKTAFAAYVDDFSNFERFLDASIAGNRLTIPEAYNDRLPSLTTMAKEMLHALEGHQPYHRKKRRIH